MRTILLAILRSTLLSIWATQIFSAHAATAQTGALTLDRPGSPTAQQATGNETVLELDLTEYRTYSAEFGITKYSIVAVEMDGSGPQMSPNEGELLISFKHIASGVVFYPYEDSSFERHFALPAGQYKINVKLFRREFDESWSDLFDDLDTQSDVSAAEKPLRFRGSLSVRITDDRQKLALIAEHPWLEELEKWLLQIGIAGRLTITNVEDPISAATRQPLSRLDSPNGDLVLTVIANLGYSQLADVVESIDRKLQTEFWWRLGAKVSLLSGAPIRQIQIFVPEGCTFHMIIFPEPGTYRDNGMGCTAATVSLSVPLSLPDPDVHTQADIITSAVADGTLSPSTFSEIIEHTLDDLAEKNDGVLTYLERSDLYTEALLSGVRGVVISGGMLWEEVQIVIFANVIDDRMQVHVFVDGALASGAGDTPPARSRFSTGMEPSYSGELQIFASALLDRVANSND